MLVISMQNWLILAKFAQKNPAKLAVFYWLFLGKFPPPPKFPVKSANFANNLPLKKSFEIWIFSTKIHEIGRFFANFDFSPAKILPNWLIFPRILTFFPPKSYKIGRIFREFAPENPTKFCFFSLKYQKPCLLVCLYTVIYWFLNCLNHSKFILCGSRKYPYPPPPHGRDLPYDPPSPMDFPKSAPKIYPPPLWNFQNFRTPPGNFAISNYWSEQRSSFVQ